MESEEEITSRLEATHEYIQGINEEVEDGVKAMSAYISDLEQLKKDRDWVNVTKLKYKDNAKIQAAVTKVQEELNGLVTKLREIDANLKQADTNKQEAGKKDEGLGTAIANLFDV